MKDISQPEKEEKKIHQAMDLTNEELQTVQGGGQLLQALQQTSINITNKELRRMQINTDYAEALSMSLTGGHHHHDDTKLLLQ